MYDYQTNLLDTSKSAIVLPVFPQPRCRFAYDNNAIAHLLSVWKDQLFRVSSPEGIISTLDIYDLKSGAVKSITNEKETITDGLIIKDNELYLFKLNAAATKEEEYVMNLRNFTAQDWKKR